MSFLSQLHSITQVAIPKRQTLRTETPLNNILIPCIAWVNNKDVKIIIKKKNQTKKHMSKSLFLQDLPLSVCFYSSGTLSTKLEFLQKPDQF